MSTAELVTTHNDGAGSDLFRASSPDQVMDLAEGISKRLTEVIDKQRMFTRIGSNKHINIEAWQTVGAFTQTHAVGDGGVRELPWPAIKEEGAETDEPPTNQKGKPTRASRAQLLAARDLGRAYGYAAAFNAVSGGRVVGWGEGRVTRTEVNWIDSDDQALASMAQTRGQSRALAAAQRWIVKLAGYESTTPAEEVSTDVWGRMAEEPAITDALVTLDHALPGARVERFIRSLEKSFTGAAGGGLPDAVARSLKGLGWWLAERAAVSPSKGEQGAASNTQDVPPDAPERPSSAPRAT